MSDTKELIFCRLCGSKKFIFLVNDIETLIGEKYSLKQCLSCTFVTIYPLPDPETLSRYYTSEYWQDSQHEHFGIGHKFFSFRMQPALRDLKRILPNGKRLLDWGTGDGSWLKVVRRAGYEGWGIDQYQTNPNNEFIRSGDIESVDFPDEHFDALTCFHVIEHLHDPISNFNAAMRKLKPGGIMIIELPNIDSLGFRIFRKKWQPLELPTHINHFSPKTLAKVIKINGRAKIIKQRYFSLRASPAALVLSIFPNLSPKYVRKFHRGRYPLSLKFIYFILQVLICPVSMSIAALNRGSIMCFTIIKL